MSSLFTYSISVCTFYFGTLTVQEFSLKWRHTLLIQEGAAAQSGEM